MTDKYYDKYYKVKPPQSPEGLRAAKAREERLAAALRANLGRRKAQARERSDEPAGGASAPAPKPASEGDPSGGAE